MLNDTDAPGSRWGQLNAGQRYTVLADDVLLAFGLAKFSPQEWAVLSWLMVESWGRATRRKMRGVWPEAIVTAWTPTKLSQKTGRIKQCLTRSKADLIAGRVLTEERDGLRINKAADQWMFQPDHSRAGEPRLTADELAFIAEYQRFSLEAPALPEVDRPKARALSAGSARAFTWKRLRFQPEAQALSRGSACASAPYKERARNEIKEDVNTDLKKREEEKTRESSEREGGGDVQETLKLPDPKAWFFQPGKHQYTEAQGHDLYKIAYTHFPGTRIPEDVYERQQWFSFDVWRHALTFTKRVKPTLGLNGNGGVAYVRSIAQRIIDGEIKPEEAPKPGLPGARTIPMGKAQARTAELLRQMEDEKQRRLRESESSSEVKHA